MILIRCGLRITDAVTLSRDCVVLDADGAPYLRYLNHKMKREALVPIDEELDGHRRADHLRQRHGQLPGRRLPVPPATADVDGAGHISARLYRTALLAAGSVCDVRDEHGRPCTVTPHQWRHTLGTRLINRDVPQEVVRRILDHDSPQMTAHYARLHDTTVRRHWEAARKVDITGERRRHSTPTGRSPRPPGPSSASAGRPRRCPTATAGCRSRRPARTPTPA